ncbi:MAG: cytochrome c oxidase assembly protein [Ilumatobacteraceae bacterium]
MPRPYVGVWLIIVALVVTRRRALRARRAATGSIGIADRQRVWFWFAIALFWLASDWPVGPLGAAYLVSIHVVQYLIYTLGVAPLLLLATPEWWLRPFLARIRAYRLLYTLARPLPAVLIANGVMLSTHAPWTADLLRSSQIGSFFLDALWLMSGLVMWLPVVSPLPEHRIESPLMRSIYLFGAADWPAALIPGRVLTLADAPLYRTYELAPRIGLDALTDQQLAGGLMNVGGGPIIWTVIGVIFYRWSARERTAGKRRSASSTRTPAVPPRVTGVALSLDLPVREGVEMTDRATAVVTAPGVRRQPLDRPRRCSGGSSKRTRRWAGRRACRSLPTRAPS